MIGLLLAVGAPLLWILSRALALYQNYITVRRLGIPIILSPVSWQDPWWLPLQPLFEPLKRLPLPKQYVEWITFSKLGWALEHRYDKHLEVGPIFAIVSPRKTEFATCDPKAAEVLLSEWKVWTKSKDLYQLFNVFGVNVNSASVQEWPRHRKIVSYGFKESNAKIVWDVSLRQAANVAKTWETKSKTVGEVSCKDLEVDSGMFSLLVLAAALWGEEHDFGNEMDELASQRPPVGHKLTYKQSLQFIMDKILLVVMFDALVLPEWLLPSPLKRLKLATSEYRLYLQEKVRNERKHLQEGGDERANLAAILVNANEIAKSEVGKATEQNRGYLSDEELYGNFFMMNLAGHETTATSVSFSMALLASHPEVQAWAREEVDAVFDAIKPYNELYSRLPRVMAIMYEELRIYGAVQNLCKYSRDGHAGQPLVVDGKTYNIPASTYVSVNFQGVHTHPGYWGQDSLQWRPQRWITTKSTEITSEHNNSTNTFGEQLGGPPEGAGFVAWAMGQRNCPGQKFSKVEFVAMIAYILKNFEIKPAVRAGETMAEAEMRLYDVVHDCKMTLAPRFKRPMEAGIVLKARS